MKVIILSLLVALAVSGGVWASLPESLPSCYTGLPFSFPLGVGYTYHSVDLPKWAIIDSSKGIITGRSEIAGAWPFNLEIRSGKHRTHRQYILNVIDSKSAEKKIWAGKADNYYGRKVVNPFRIIASRTHKTFVNVG